MTRIAILASGSGSTAQALLDASVSNELAGGAVVLVLSDRSKAQVLERARTAGVEALFIGAKEFPDREAYCAALARALSSRSIEVVCLAGFMKILTHNFVSEYRGRMLNTHPALLPSFPGAHPVRDALDWGVKVTGATIHLVDDGVDSGPIVLQEAVAVSPGDDEETLHEKIKEIERQLYPQALRALVGGRLEVEGRLVKINESQGASS